MRRYEEELYRFMERAGPSVLAQIAEKKILDDRAAGGARSRLLRSSASNSPAAASQRQWHRSRPSMPSLIDLRRRIRAVKSTQQITKAMKMIAASRLKRAQDRVIAARPFAQRMQQVLNSLAARVEPDAHPLLRTADHRAAAAHRRSPPIEDCAEASTRTSSRQRDSSSSAKLRARGMALELVGRKGRDFFRRRGFDVIFEQVGIFQHLTFAHAVEIANAAIEEFVSGRASRVHLVYNEFKP